MIRPMAAAIAATLLVAACDRSPTPAAPPPAAAVPAPVLRGPLPVIELRETVPLPRAKPKHKATKILPPPYPCAAVQLANRLYNRTQLESWARSQGITEQQRRAALSCLK